MQNVARELEAQVNAVPFTMLTLVRPEKDDVLTPHSAMATTSSVYGTTCGVNNNSPDDAETVTKDD